MQGVNNTAQRCVQRHGFNAKGFPYPTDTSFELHSSAHRLALHNQLTSSQGSRNLHSLDAAILLYFKSEVGQAAMSSEETVPIPQPPPHLFIGNVTEIDPSNQLASFQRLADIYGEIFQLDLPGRQGKTIVVSSHATVNDCCDAERFEKPIDGSLKQVRNLTGDGLLTAYPGEKVSAVMRRRYVKLILV